MGAGPPGVRRVAARTGPELPSPERPHAERPDAERPDVQAISILGPAELDEIMGPARSRDIAVVSDWIVRRARDRVMPGKRIKELCKQLIDAGLPLDRYGSSTETLDAEHDAIGRVWVRGEGVVERIYVRPAGVDEHPDYLASPFYAATKSGRWVEIRIPETPDSAFGIVADLRQDGYTHYLCTPITLINDAHGWFTFATKARQGFGAADVASIARILPALSLLVELRSTWASLQNLLRTYVGTDPREAILRGKVKRGQVSAIKSAMLFADMRDSVGHTADLSATKAVAVFNELFDCLVPAIESRRGEVLKYIGDGLLAIFREGGDLGCDAAHRALAAAEAALEAIEERNRDHPDRLPFQVGVALHYGEVAYGNVGSGTRLDFTVIGKDVGMASRIAGMNRPLGEPLLMSDAFVRRLGVRAFRLGAFPARGFKDPLLVYRPASSEGGAP